MWVVSYSSEPLFAELLENAELGFKVGGPSVRVRDALRQLPGNHLKSTTQGLRASVAHDEDNVHDEDLVAVVDFGGWAWVGRGRTLGARTQLCGIECTARSANGRDMEAAARTRQCGGGETKLGGFRCTAECDRRADEGGLVYGEMQFFGLLGGKEERCEKNGGQLVDVIAVSDRCCKASLFSFVKGGQAKFVLRLSSNSRRWRWKTASLCSEECLSSFIADPSSSCWWISKDQDLARKGPLCNDKDADEIATFRLHQPIFEFFLFSFFFFSGFFLDGLQRCPLT